MDTIRTCIANEGKSIIHVLHIWVVYARDVKNCEMKLSDKKLRKGISGEKAENAFSENLKT